MTTITIRSGLFRHRIKAEGHTEPEVCHGVSALMFMIAGCALNDAWIHDQDIRDGYIYLDFFSLSMRAEMKALKIGLLQIEKAHPDKLKVVIKK